MASLRERFAHFLLRSSPDSRNGLPIVGKEKDVVTQAESTELYGTSQLSELRSLSQDRRDQYDAYDSMATDPVIASALEIYADDATQYDERGRIIWVESDDDEIAKAGNRLLSVLGIVDHAWKHIYLACKYGDYYLKLFREDEKKEDSDKMNQKSVKLINDVVTEDNLEFTPPYEEYVEEVDDPAVMYDLQVKGKTAGFVELSSQSDPNVEKLILGKVFSSNEIKVYRPDRFVHIVISDTMTRFPETITLSFGEDDKTTYKVKRGKSILHDVYPVEQEIRLLEDTLLLNRLTRSSLIRLLEIEVGDMAKSEVNDYLRRMKNLIEQHIAFDKTTGNYKSYQSPGPIDNVIYIPVKNGKGSVSVNNLGGDVNVRDIVDIDYFNNKRAGALKIPKAFLGEDLNGSGLDNGGSLTRMSVRYARTVKRIQSSYISAITTLLNLFFIDKKLDYVNKFQVRMTSPSTQEDLERNELIGNTVDLVKSIMELTESLEGDTQKKVLVNLVSDFMRMPEIASIIEEDKTPPEDVDIDVEGGGSGPDLKINTSSSPGEDTLEISSDQGETEVPEDQRFTDQEFSEFEDEI